MKELKNTYSYITYITTGNLFIAGAIVLAHSIRESGSEQDLTVLVTPDITQHERDILGTYYNHVVLISNIKLDIKTHKYYKKYLELELLKFKAFDLNNSSK